MSAIAARLAVMRGRMGLRVFVAAAAAVVGVGCGSAGDGRRFTLAGDNVSAAAPAFDVNAARIVADGQNDPEADFYLSLTMVVMLYPTTPEGGLCLRGTGLARAEDIDVPADLATCTFFGAMLGGNGPHPDSMYAGDGYLVRDRQGALAGKLLIVTNRILPGGRAEVMFDFLRL